MQNERQKIGQIGENIAVNYLKKNGYQILKQNFKTKLGELDIVAQKNKTIVFVEVKTLKFFPNKKSDLSPEDEITFHKTEQLRKMTQIYLSYHKLPLDTEQQIDILAIELNNDFKTANIRHLENAIDDY